MNRQFEICLDLDCNVKDATEIVHEIVRMIGSYGHITKVSNFVMRDSSYHTLFTMYPTDKLIAALKAHNEAPPAEPEENESEVDA